MPGKEIWAKSVGLVSNLVFSYILKHFQTAYQVFGEESLAKSGDVQFRFFKHPKACSNSVRPKASNILENAVTPTLMAFGRLPGAAPL